MWIFLIARLLAAYLIFSSVSTFEGAVKAFLGLLLLLVSVLLEVKGRLLDAIEEAKEKENNENPSQD